MAELDTAHGEGLDIGLAVFGDDGGKRSLIYLNELGYDRMVGLDNMQALTLAHELIALANVNDDRLTE